MNDLSPDSLQQALWALAGFLEIDGAESESLVVIGGSALMAMGFVSRTTRDVDVMASVDTRRGLLDPRPLSSALCAAVQNVARELQIHPQWLNTGPADLMLAELPDGFFSRLTRHEYGPCLSIYFPARIDLIHLKLFAVVDQGFGRHVHDLRALNPTKEELLKSAFWVLKQDAGDSFPRILRDTLAAIGHDDLAQRIPNAL